MSTKGTTRRRILEVIVECADSRCPAPTVRELGEEVGLSSTSSTQEHIRLLVRDGLVTREIGKCRTLQPTDAGRKAVA